MARTSTSSSRKPKPPDLNFAAAPFSRRRPGDVVRPPSSVVRLSSFVIPCSPRWDGQARIFDIPRGHCEHYLPCVIARSAATKQSQNPPQKSVDSAADGQYYIHQSIISQVNLDARRESGIEERSCNGFYHCNIRNQQKRLLPTRSSHECHRQG